jgi:O-antigen/teichoic acid export membrane protein
MNSTEKNLVKNTLLFSIGNTGAKLLMLVIIPLYTFYVTTEQMGQYDMITTYVGLFSPLACLSLHEGIYRWLLDSHTSKEDALKSGIYISMGFLIVFDLVALLLLSYIRYDYIPEFILLVDAAALYTIAQFTTRGLRNNKVYAVQGIIYSVILIICNLIMVIWKHMQSRGLLLSMAIAYLITTFFMIVVQHLWSRYIKNGKLDFSLTIDLLKYSLPIVPNSTAWWLVAGLNRIIINIGMGDTANGIYAISMKFPTLVNLMSTFFYQAWQEQAITEYESKERDAYYTKIFNIYSKLLLTGIIALIPVTKFIILFFMDSSYSEAYKFVGPLYLSSVFNAFACFYGTGYNSTKKTAGALTTTIYGALTNVIFAMFLINTAGLYAAAIGSMLGNGVIWFARVIQTIKYFNISVNKKSLIILVIASVLMMFIVNKADVITMLFLEVVACIMFLIINRSLILPILKKLICVKKRLFRLINNG